MNTRTQLRELLDTRSAVLAPGVFDGLSAALTASTGFSAAYLSGAAVSASAVGLPDIALTTQTEMVRQLGLVAGLLDIPVVADADTGFGDITNTFRTVGLYEQAGAAAIQLEDQEFPKRCGHLDDKQVIDAAEFARKIEVAVRARRDPETVIIARTDCRAISGYEEAIRRLNLYAEAGADMVFFEAPQSIDEIARIPSSVSVPALFNLVPRGKTPQVEIAQLAEFGYALVILPGVNISSAAAAMRSALLRLAGGDVGTANQDSLRELFDTVGLEFWEDLRNRFGGEAPAA